MLPGGDGSLVDWDCIYRWQMADGRWQMGKVVTAAEVRSVEKMFEIVH